MNAGYIDKTGLISLINSTINTREMLSCVSRPRRFGKSYAANMLEAYESADDVLTLLIHFGYTTAG